MNADEVTGVMKWNHWCINTLSYWFFIL